MKPAIACLAATLCCLLPVARAAPPVLFRQPFNESPVRAGPGQLLLLSGELLDRDDTVVYARLADNGQLPIQPDALPRESTADAGLAAVVDASGAPRSLVVRFPEAVRGDHAYAIRVRSPTGEWSEPVLVNDARPLWLTPAMAYASSMPAGLPREIKIVGRNLQPAAGLATRIHLLGPQSLWLDAQPPPVGTPVLAEYVAKAALPPRLAPGRYRVEVSRGSGAVVPLAGQTFEVRADPVTPRRYSPGDAAQGGCRPSDEQDDSACVARAVAAAARAGGGVVELAAGDWLLDPRALPEPGGLVLPPGVALRGAGAARSRIVRMAGGDPAAPAATFTLMGSNSVSGLSFTDRRSYARPARAPMLLLGTWRDESAPGNSDPHRIVRDVEIFDNEFDRVETALASGGSPIEGLYVTRNRFAAFATSLALGGNVFYRLEPFRIEDAVITGNRFEPGNYVDVTARQGSIASELGAGTRIDFSGNDADGTANAGAWRGPGARGWRAAYFFSLNNNLERLLVAGNKASCTGDKGGDGEAIAFDNNGNAYPFESAREVVAAGADSVTVRGALAPVQFDRPADVDVYYLGHWVQVGDGPGTGQARKITSYVQDAALGIVTFRIAPAWDVRPQAGTTRVAVGREAWQAYVVGNEVDHRSPACLGGARPGKRGGVIAVWSQSADMVVAGNRQYATDGIAVQYLYTEPAAGCRDCGTGSQYVTSLSIRDNLIDGEFEFADGCSASGIFGSLAAAPVPGSRPATVGYGIDIEHNEIRGADGRWGGAISFHKTWFDGPAPHRWPLIASTIIQRNLVAGMDAAPALACQGERRPARTAISLGDAALVDHAVLYANRCPGAQHAVEVGPGKATLVCAPIDATGCGCPR